MATVIKIKNTNLDKAPVDGLGDSLLATGELAYSYATGAQNNDGDRLYIGTGVEVDGLSASVDVIGGKYFTDLMDHVHGTLTASSGVIVDANKKIDEWRVDNIVFDGNTISIDQISDANGNLSIIPGGASSEVIVTAGGGITLNGDTTVVGDLSFTGALTQTGDVDIDGALSVTGESTLASAIVSDLTATRITFAGTAGALVDSADLTFSATGNLNVGQGQFTVDVATGNTDIAGTLDVTGETTLASAIVSDLTDNRVVIAGASGAIEDDANFTFNGTQLALGVTQFTVQQSSGNVYTAGTLETDGEATLASAIIEDLTAGRITLAGTGGAVEDDANLTFNGTTLSVGQGNFTVAQATGNTAIAGTLGVTGESTLASATVSDLTDNRIVIAGTAGSLEDDSNFTFDGTSFKVGTTTTDKFVVDVASGNTDIEGTLTVDGAVSFTGTSGTVLDVDGQAAIASLNVEDLTTTRVVFAGANGELVDDANFTFDNVNDKLTINGSLAVDNVVVDTNTISTSTGALTLQPAANAETVINTTSALRLPVGNSTERPSAVATGQIRYNTTTSQFEGYAAGNWNGLGGVIDVDQDTYITAETSPGTDNDQLEFYTGGTYQGKVETATGWTFNDINVDGSTISSTTGNDLYLDPGQTGAGSPTGNVVVYGNLNVMGTTTTIDSTTITVDDPVFTLGGDGTPTADDNKDRGIEFKWHDGTNAKVGFFGYDDSAERFVFVADATNTSEVFAGSVSDVAFGNALLDSVTFSSGNFTANSVPWVDTNGDVGFLEEVASDYGTEGQVLQMNASGVPTFGHIDCGTY